MTVRIVGLDEALETLKRLDQPNLDKASQRVVMAAARSLVTPIRRAAPVGKTGNLARSISARKGRKKGQAIVGPRAKKAPHRHLVIGGTKPHTIRAKRGFLSFGGMFVAEVQHPGTRSNPFVDRAVAGQESHIEDFVGRQLVKELGL